MRQALQFQHNFKVILIAGLIFISAGCSSLLPHSTQESKTPWHDYAEAHALFDKIVPQQTSIADLKSLGFDPQKTSNISILNHADLLRRLMSNGSFDIGLLDTTLRTCQASKSTCFAYEIEQTYTNKKRVGNFWLDFMNFDKETDISGWQFDALVVINDDLVIYKQWSGKPSIHQFEQERNPLGPFQGWGPSLLQMH